MGESGTELYYIPYEDLRQNESIPKSFFGFLWWLIRQLGRGLIKGFPKNLLTPLVLMLTYFIANTVYLSFINDTMYLGFHYGSNLISYFFSGVVLWNGYLNPSVKGFDYIPVNTVNLFWTMPMLFLLINLVYSLIRRLGTKGFNKFMGDIGGAGKLAKLYGKASSRGISGSIILGCFWGMIMGFFVQSPISLFILPITLFLSFTLREEGKIIGIVSMCLISINISKKEPKYVNIADIALGILGLSVGFALYFLLVLMMWLIFDYVILARLVFTTIFALMFLFIYKAKNKKLVKEVANTTMIIFFIVCILWIANC